TSVSVRESDLPRFSDGHSGERKRAHWDFDALAGAGAIRSTASDMTRFLAFNMGLEHCGLDAALKAAQTPRSETGSPDLEMALGWHIWKRHGAEIFWHNGGTAGFHSFCGFRPDKKLGVVVLANDTYNIDAIGLHALEPKFDMPEIQKSIRVDGKILDRYVGWYLLSPSMRIEITRAGDTLKAQMTGQDAYSVYPIADNRFVYRVVAAELEFERAADGSATAMILHQNGHDQRFERAPADFKPPAPPTEISVDPKVLASYVGVYQLAPGFEFDIRLKDEQLMARLTGQPSFPVFAESPTTFFYKVVEAKLTFESDADGKVVALTLHQHGRDQRAEKIR
ncbi:MAG: DUF3471 domain-containing protein, partial [Phycisphaerales bacterium]|nr:DUF3471 domain-containing protein [Phycisphaerales bacterium]